MYILILKSEVADWSRGTTPLHCLLPISIRVNDRTVTDGGHTCAQLWIHIAAQMYAQEWVQECKHTCIRSTLICILAISNSANDSRMIKGAHAHTNKLH